MRGERKIQVLGASWYKCLGRAGSSVWGELVQVFGASWYKCLGRAGTSGRGELVQVLGASWYKWSSWYKWLGRAGTSFGGELAYFSIFLVLTKFSRCFSDGDF